MLGREVMLPANLIAKPLEEPMESKIPFVLGFRDALRDAHLRVRKATRKSALNACNFNLDNWSGYIGRNLRFAKNLKSCLNYGQVHGKLTTLKAQ